MKCLCQHLQILFQQILLWIKIWGYDTDSDISVVWVYISYLRKKLAKLEADVEIKVTRNVGYSLEL